MKKKMMAVGSLAGLAALAGWKKTRKVKTPAEKLRNPEGVGSTHISGVPRGEEQMTKNGSYEVTSVAGRVAGSIHPESRGPGGPHGHESKSSWGRKRWGKWAGTSLAPVAAPAPLPSRGPGGSDLWASSFPPRAPLNGHGESAVGEPGVLLVDEAPALQLAGAAVDRIPDATT
jgi:hypothetical protein